MELIVEHRISGLCVVDDKGDLLGVLSELDCLRAVVDAAYNNVDPGPVSDYMSREDLAVCHPEDDVVDAAREMVAARQRRRPVVEDGRLVGQLTCRQLLAAAKAFGQ
jgi:CBS domain-containing protein